MLEIQAFHSHLYPGAQGRLIGDPPVEGTLSEAVILFSDGSSARAELSGEVLTVAPYVTDAGTRIGGKSWQLALTEQAHESSFKIIGKTSAQDA